MITSTSKIDFQDVSVIFGNSTAVALDLLDQGKTREEIHRETGSVVGTRSVTLAIETGEIFVLMGLSGSGKSTLLRCINGLVTPARGSVHVRHGQARLEVASCSPDERRELRAHQVSMVFQHFALLPWRTVSQNVALGLELAGMPRAERLQKVQDQLERVGLEAWADKPMGELSGGMQQRVGLARALVTDADILLMDEPFSALDPLIRSRLQEELLDLQERLEKTIVFVSHDLNEAFRLGSRVAIMDCGEVVQQGRPEDILRRPANDYVADFIAHLNPLNVMKARWVMKPAESPIDPDTHLTVTPETPIREVIKARHQSGLPVFVMEGQTVLGIIDDDALFQAITAFGTSKPPDVPSRGTKQQPSV